MITSMSELRPGMLYRSSEAHLIKERDDIRTWRLALQVQPSKTLNNFVNVMYIKDSKVDGWFYYGALQIEVME